jgi:NOL1/NOP2/sun family putative RNA methylase
MIQLPPLYLQSMQRLLGGEFEAFRGIYSAAAVIGLRANTLKISPGELARRLPYALRAVPWCPAGFQLIGEPSPDLPRPGKHPYHAAGLYYLQEPSAMAVAELLDPQPGERLLDLCAAPGGKTTHLAAKMDGQGVLAANEVHPRRVWELAENLERWGTRNAIILNENPPLLAERLPGWFDRVLVDAPCSGEGMFRKSEAALRDWSPELVRSCAVRQSAILEAGARLTRPGGVLVYSTCTFNPQENEQTVAGFLDRHPQFELAAVQPLPGLSAGRPEWVEGGRSHHLERAARLWPHQSAGEGHFIAVLRRSAAELSGDRSPSGSKPVPLDRAAHHRLAAARRAFAAFCQEHLTPTAQAEFPEDRLKLVGENLYLVPPQAPHPGNLRLIRPGWWLGSFRAGEKRRGDRFEPSHALALGLKMDDFQPTLNLEGGSERTLAYLRGEVLDWAGEGGWVLVGVDGFPLGWGRGVQNRLKNHYPRGLRWA